MAKLSLKASPTFKASVGIPVAGGETVAVLMEFKHRTKSELEDFMKTRGGKTDTESFMEIVLGWDLEDKFNTENVEQLLQSYIGAALATLHVYVDELVRHKAKN